MMTSYFILSKWSAWAPGIESLDDSLITDASVGAPESIPNMLLRRLTPMARAVFNVADQCVNKGEALPVVFSSAHGEICKSLTMLKAIQSEDELSPVAFSLSVHNAIAGLFSIAYGNTQEITVIASGQEGIAPAFIDALGMLHEGAKEVLMVFYDEPIPDFYPVEPFKLSVPLPCVLALRIALNGDGMPLQIHRCNQSRVDGEHILQLRAFIKFLITDERLLSLGNGGHSWTWNKK